MNDELSELRARYERLQLLYDVSNVIRSTLDPQEAMNLIVAQAVRVTGASSGSVVLVNPTTLLLEIHASHGLSSDASQLRLRVGEGITGWVTEFGKPARIGDVRTDPRYVQARDSVRSELAVPLEVRGEVHGVLNVDSDRENAFSESDQILLTELAAQATGDHNTELTILIPRHEYTKAWHRLLHDRSSNAIVAAISDTPHCNVTIVPFHLGRRSATPPAAPARELVSIQGSGRSKQGRPRRTCRR